MVDVVRAALAQRCFKIPLVFQEGFECYVKGDWLTAKKRFEECLEIKENDGPTRNLYNFLQGYDFIAPEDWNGYRTLTEK